MIEFRDLSLSVKNRQLFVGYNLKIEQGEKVVFSSVSGSGKTTLFRLLMGFQQPDAGEIIVNGQLLEPKTVKEIRHSISYISQDVDLQKTSFSELLDDIYSYEANKELSRNNDEVIQLLKRFKLNEEYLDKIIPELSGGERQRLGLIICCLLQRPIWLLDEPTTALDEELKNLVVENVMQAESTALIISHEKHWLDQKKIRAERW
jgi:putative ABC transport system ATP-binding protein